MLRWMVLASVLKSPPTLGALSRPRTWSSASPDHSVESPRQLYKFLVRALKRLPEPDCKFYQDSVRRGFSQHVDESDPERVRQIIDRSVQDLQWVLAKYKIRS